MIFFNFCYHSFSEITNKNECKTSFTFFKMSTRSPQVYSRHFRGRMWLCLTALHQVDGIYFISDYCYPPLFLLIQTFGTYTWMSTDYFWNGSTCIAIFVEHFLHRDCRWCLARYKADKAAILKVEIPASIVLQLQIKPFWNHIWV